MVFTPADLRGHQTFHGLSKSDDMYLLNAKNLADYGLPLLKAATSALLPQEATSLFLEGPAKFLLDSDLRIVRSDEEISTWREENGAFKPYWDPTLAGDQSARVELYKVLASKGLIVSRIKARCVAFILWNSIRKVIRLSIDARESNACHRRPPRAYLG